MPLKDWGDEDDGGFPPIETPTPDPYANWGGGPDGDGTDGSGDTGASGGREYWDKIIAALAKGGGPGGAAPGGGSLSDILKALGLTNGGGAGSMIPLLAALFGAGGLINSNSKNKDAAKQIQDASNKANEQATGLISGARQDFQPYMAAGTNAVGNLSGMVGNSNLAGQYGGPVAPGENLADKFKGSMSLAALARK